MGEKKLLLVLVFLITINVVSALDCQYAENFTIGTETKSTLWWRAGEEIINPLSIKNFENYNSNSMGLNNREHSKFEVHNSLDIPVNVTVQFISLGTTTYQTKEILGLYTLFP